MALLDWSMVMAGYPANERNRLRSVGVSHMSTHSMLRVAEHIGIYTGWIACAGVTEQFDRDRDDPQWTVLAELFVENRVANTEGMTSGTVTLVGAVPADGDPPADRDLIDWAEENGRVWVQVLDNERAYWGGLSDQQIERLLVWFLNQRPLNDPWQDQELHKNLRKALLSGLFQHGWTRNCSLVEEDGKAGQQVWGGIPKDTDVDRDDLSTLQQVDTGWYCSRSGQTWKGLKLDIPCPLDEVRGRTYGRA